MTRLLPLLTLAASIPQAAAWGAMAHYAVAYVATNFITTDTRSYLQTLLADTSTDYLATVASWADSYRSTSTGAFSAPFHYIDALDNPPSSCGVSFSRDCGSSGCIVGAISNYTTRLLTTSLTTTDRQIAAKMLVHFLGDIGQPLHCENLDVGGNDIDVTYSGASTNLHTVWDTKIPEHISGGSTKAVAKTWAASLTAGKSPSSSPLPKSLPLTPCPFFTPRCPKLPFILSQHQHHRRENNDPDQKSHLESTPPPPPPGLQA